MRRAGWARGNRMGFKYEDEELELHFQAQAYKFRAPSAKEQQAFIRGLSSIGKDEKEGLDIVDHYVEFFKGLGLPEDVLVKMSMKGLAGLLDYATGSKKN